jgi:hypothetical protein
LVDLSRVIVGFIIINQFVVWFLRVDLMIGLLLLKQLENLSDERVVLQFKRNPYYQYFCGHSRRVKAFLALARFLT